MNKYKIKDSQKIMGLIKVFEEQSINVKAEKEMKKIVNKVIFISIGVCIISEIIKKMPILNFIFLLLGVGGIIAYMMKQFSTILYKYTKDLGGKKYKIFSKEKFSEIGLYNKKIMAQSEEKLLERILKANSLYKIKCMKEILEYLKYTKKTDKYDEANFAQIVIGAYAIPITFNVISIYTSLIKTELEQSILTIVAITLLSIIVVAGIYIIFIIKKIKMLSITNSYTYPCLIKNLTNFIVIKSSK